MIRKKGEQGRGPRVEHDSIARSWTFDTGATRSSTRCYRPVRHRSSWCHYPLTGAASNGQTAGLGWRKPAPSAASLEKSALRRERLYRSRACLTITSDVAKAALVKRSIARRMKGHKFVRPATPRPPRLGPNRSQGRLFAPSGSQESIARRRPKAPCRKLALEGRVRLPCWNLLFDSGRSTPLGRRDLRLLSPSPGAPRMRLRMHPDSLPISGCLGRSPSPRIGRACAPWDAAGPKASPSRSPTSLLTCASRSIRSLALRAPPSLHRRHYPPLTIRVNGQTAFARWRKFMAALGRADGALPCGERGPGCPPRRGRRGVAHDG